MLSFTRSEILMGSKHGLHLCACSLITTCRWSLRCNWGDHSLVKLNSLFTVQWTMCMSCFQGSQLFVVASLQKMMEWSSLHLGVTITLIHVCCWALKFVRVLWYVCGCLFWPNVVLGLIQLYWASWVCVGLCSLVEHQFAHICSPIISPVAFIHALYTFSCR